MKEHQRATIEQELRDAELKAWESLARYKFMMFGYWVGVWVHLRRVSGVRQPNPWAGLVAAARAHLATIGVS